MLQDLNYGTNIEPIQPVLKKMQAQIDYLDKAKANCMNVKTCNCSGYITFSIDNDGNETITGKHNLAVPICGYTDIETPLNDLLTSGGGGLATCVLQDACNCYGAIFLGNGCDGEYSRIGINSDLSYNNDTLHAPNISTITATLSNICTCNGLSIDSTIEIKNGDIKAIGPTNCSIVSNTGCGTFTNQVTTPTVEANTLCEVSNIYSSTNIISFKDKNNITLGSINGTAICFTDGNFTNVNTNNFSASVLSNKCGYLGEATNSLLVAACNANNVIIQNGCGCQLTLADNCLKYDKLLDIGDAYWVFSSASAVSIGKGAVTFNCDTSQVTYALGKRGTYGSTRTVTWLGISKQCDVFKMLREIIPDDGSSRTWSIYGVSDYTEALGRKVAPVYLQQDNDNSCFVLWGFPVFNGSNDVSVPISTIYNGCECPVNSSFTFTITIR